jgi:hypothetical protein
LGLSELLCTGRAGRPENLVRCDMATERQVEYYRYLCEQACIEVDDDCEDWTSREMSKAIKELMEIVES